MRKLLTLPAQMSLSDAENITYENAFNQATEIISQLRPGMAHKPEISSAVAAFELAKLGQNNSDNPSELEKLKKHIVSSPQDTQARYDYANALLGVGQNQEALNELLTIVKIDHNWNDNAARDQILRIFEALGPDNHVTQDGRRQLSAILFS